MAAGDRAGSGATDPVVLAGLLADLTQAGPDDIAPRILDVACETVPGCDHATLSALRERGGSLTTLAASTDVAERVDGLQRRAGQGPGLSALAGPKPVHAPDLGRERRFPVFAEATVRLTPVRSALAVRLPPGSPDGDPVGVLSLYAERTEAFRPADADLGRVLAAHAGLAVTAAGQRRRIENLDRALETNREIGMAIGVLMATRGLTRDQAFAALRTSSQRHNVKLRAVAAHVVRRGELPRS